MTGRKQTLPVVAERRRGKDDRKQNTLAPLGRGKEKRRKEMKRPRES
jgi:hypothetical protein